MTKQLNLIDTIRGEYDPNQEWVPVDKFLPDEDEWMLVALVKEEYQRQATLRIAHFCPHRKAWISTSVQRVEVTHWRTLPDGPNGAG